MGPTATNFEGAVLGAGVNQCVGEGSIKHPHYWYRNLSVGRTNPLL